ncbi:MnmC family methyltransferase [Helicobacter trogontum]|uniref:MnmC-like methyltransferase domain-containing protein n=1 Tax=Helicobacter trogontum TaxID=50960 RepID=A0A4U8TID4_9HELI|nr:MnmC family methyltransferase [Helicobacter trogontum]MDY5185650.1 MnmC family methyltransferase [Helicobacter trogontum]TLD99474.1 hypothetical protein LS80_000920 [Helicobacter trogontum]
MAIYNDAAPIYDNIVQGLDKSFSVYNATYKQSYHSKSLGAYSETLLKHIYPALFFQQYGSFCDENTRKSFLTQVDSIQKYYKINTDLTPLQHNISTLIQSLQTQNLTRPVRILDICFGLGYNAMLALTYFKTCEIYSPEKDLFLQELSDFPYQNIPQSKTILHMLYKQSYYHNKQQTLYYLHGNALAYLLQFRTGFFDIVFQDAFSQAYNEELWDTKYFQTLYKITKTPCIITTYAKARVVLEVAKRAGFNTLKYTWGSIFYK